MDDCHISGQIALEIGADRYSVLSPFLASPYDWVDCSYYDPQSFPAIKKFNERFQCRNINYSHRDITNLAGRWDLIFAKSVLEGVFRKDVSSLQQVSDLIQKIRAENLVPGGWLVLMENGSSILEPLLRRAGARKNKWRFFHRQDLPTPDYYTSFGVFSAFSFIFHRLSVLSSYPASYYPFVRL